MQADQGNRAGADSQAPAGVVELREDVPLKSSAFGSDSRQCCGGGPRFILACFAVLSGLITVALLAQIYHGVAEFFIKSSVLRSDCPQNCGGGPHFILACFAMLSDLITVALLAQIYHGLSEVVPHGSVSSSAEDCSRAGTAALEEGGRAVDAAVVAALCLAVLAPHRTSLDASGSILYWEYRTSHIQPPTLAEWGGPESVVNMTVRPPKLLSALASLHAMYGVLPWSRVLQPAIDLAKNGFNISAGLAAAAAARGDTTMLPGTERTSPQLASYLQKIQANTSTELAKGWSSDKLIRNSEPHEVFAGAWRMYSGGAGGLVAGKALVAGVQSPLTIPEDAFHRVITALQNSSMQGEWPPSGVSSGLAIVDTLDTYVALVIGLSKPFGSGPISQDGWLRDEPASAVDLAPAIILDDHVCGTRYIIGAESSSALAQGAAALLTSGIGVGAVESPRVSVYANGVLAKESSRKPPEEDAIPGTAPEKLVNATLPYPAVNVVQQTGDALMSHADSRGGGMASRF